MRIQTLKNLDESDLDKPLWRYLTFPKYISMLSYGALWFPKLNILQDKFEGHMPAIVDAEMRAEHERLKQQFHPSLHGQFDRMNQRNVDDGRELTAVSCWFLSPSESPKMWSEYTANCEGVAVKSTVRSLADYIFCDPQYSTIGKVKYVDFDTHTMSPYEANQAQERAFLKGKQFEHESEVRIATFSLRGPMCVGLDGDPLKPQEYQGAGMNNFDYDGLYIRSDLARLIKGTVLKPNSRNWFELLIKRIVKLSKIGAPVERSSLEQ